MLCLASPVMQGGATASGRLGGHLQPGCQGIKQQRLQAHEQVHWDEADLLEDGVHGLGWGLAPGGVPCQHHRPSPSLHSQFNAQLYAKEQVEM